MVRSRQGWGGGGDDILITCTYLVEPIYFTCTYLAVPIYFYLYLFSRTRLFVTKYSFYFISAIISITCSRFMLKRTAMPHQHLASPDLLPLFVISSTVLSYKIRLEPDYVSCVRPFPSSTKTLFSISTSIFIKRHQGLVTANNC